MGWLDRLFHKISGSAPIDYIFVDKLALPGAPDGPAFKAGEVYVELYVEALRLEKARRFTTKFHGVVYSFVRLASLGKPTSEIAAISKPNKIAELDKSSIGKVITISKQMMGAVPWQGGRIGIELGLFSVKSGDILTPVTNFVTHLSDAAGISFVGAVKPFLPLITEGMDLLSGQAEDCQLEVGLDTDMEIDGAPAMCCAIIAAPKGTFDPARLAVDPTDRKLLYEGQPLDAGYCVFSLRVVSEKPDFGEIPELKALFEDVMALAREGDEERVKEALAAFRRAALTSSDLILTDARRLVKLTQERVNEVLGEPVIEKRSVSAFNLDYHTQDRLADLPLYQ